MNTTPTEDTSIAARAVESGLWALVLQSLRSEGLGAQTATLQSVLKGKAFVECTVRFTKSGTELVGEYASHSGKSNLFTITMRTPQDDAATQH